MAGLGKMQLERDVAEQRGIQLCSVFDTLFASYQLFSPCHRVRSYALHY